MVCCTSAFASDECINTGVQKGGPLTFWNCRCVNKETQEHTSAGSGYDEESYEEGLKKHCPCCVEEDGPGGDGLQMRSSVTISGEKCYTTPVLAGTAVGTFVGGVLLGALTAAVLTKRHFSDAKGYVAFS